MNKNIKPIVLKPGSYFSWFFFDFDKRIIIGGKRIYFGIK